MSTDLDDILAEIEARPDYQYITSAELALMLGKREQTIRCWRMTGYGPKFEKSRRDVRYLLAEARRWRREHTFRTTAEAKAVAEQEKGPRPTRRSTGRGPSELQSRGFGRRSLPHHHAGINRLAEVVTFAPYRSCTEA